MVSLRSLFGDDAGVLREGNFQLLLLVTVMLPFGNGLLSPILDSLIDPLDASVGSIGLLVSAFLAPGVVLIPFVGAFADRYGRKPILVPSLLLFGAAGVAITLTSEFRVALALRLLQGVGWAGLGTLIIVSLGDMYSGTRETTAQGLRMSAVGVAGASISVVAGVVVVVAWQGPFLLYALAIPVAVAVGLWFDEPTGSDSAATDPSEMEADAEMETAVEEEAVDEEATPDGGWRETYLRGLLGLVRRRRVAAMVLARTLPIVAFLGFLTYNSVLVVRLLGGTPAQAGILYALVSVVYATGASQAGRVTRLAGGRYRALLGANACLGAGLVVVFLAPTLLVAGVGAVIVGVGFGVILPAYNTIITGFAPEHLRAGLVSISSTGTRLTGVLAPVAMGWAITALTPSVGFGPAVQLTGVGTALLVGGGGIAGVLAAMAAPPVDFDAPDGVEEAA